VGATGIEEKEEDPRGWGLDARLTNLLCEVNPWSERQISQLKKGCGVDDDDDDDDDDDGTCIKIATAEKTGPLLIR
jgi:hypothetical protein